ncbi:hypothetical protein [Marinicauda salina]|uniref:hypothetical protein n=1 Tax=Marinicauda salina TaxID=2135793 RepID=UPI0011B24924|nr:hypothetical protein [Marinicauda salina]
MATVKDLTPKDLLAIKRRLKRGDLQHEIAADYRINQGRISEINTGKRSAEIKPDGPDQPGLF